MSIQRPPPWILLSGARGPLCSIWEAMETAALWKGGGKPNNRFPPPFHRAWKTLRPKRSEFPTVPTASATGYRFVRKTSQRAFRMFYFSSGKHAISKKLKPMQFLFSCNIQVKKICHECKILLIICTQSLPAFFARIIFLTVGAYESHNRYRLFECYYH